MGRCVVCGEDRRMQFEEAYSIWMVGGVSQADAARLLGVSDRTMRRWVERYAALADGRFERRRLDPYGGAGADAEEAPPAPEAAAKANGLRPNRSGRGIDG